MSTFGNNIREVCMDIRCRKTNCEFNDRYTCKAKRIEVSDKAVCKKFVKGNKTVDRTKNMFDEPPKYAPQRDSKTIGIECCAHCLFNVDRDCKANGITLNDLKSKPCCITFLRK